jgi:hypothetical protein
MADSGVLPIDAMESSWDAVQAVSSLVLYNRRCSAVAATVEASLWRRK